MFRKTWFAFHHNHSLYSNGCSYVKLRLSRFPLEVVRFLRDVRDELDVVALIVLAVVAEFVLYCRLYCLREQYWF